MVEKRNTSVIGSTLKKPKIAALTAILTALVFGFAANFYLSQMNVKATNSYIQLTSDLKVLAQQTAKNAAIAANGSQAVFLSLAEGKDQFKSKLGQLKDGRPVDALPASPTVAKGELAKLDKLWGQTSTQIDIVLSNRDALVQLRDISGDLAITMSAIQLENEKIVAAMVGLQAPAIQIARAQGQSLLIERMSRTVDRVIEMGSTQSLEDNFSRDAGNFSRVLQGLSEGNRDLQLTPIKNGAVVVSLNKVAELFRTVSTRMNEITTRSQDVDRVKQASQVISLASDDLVSQANRLTSIYQSAAGAGLASPLIGVGFGALGIVILIMLSLIIASEASRNVSETARQNEQNQAAILQLLDELADLADGDLRVQATVTESFTGAIADSINFSIDQLRSLVSQINKASGMVSTATEQTQSSLGVLSEASQRQAKEITDVSEAVNEMAVSIDMVSYNAAESSSVAERSVNIANKGASVVQNTIGGMENIRGQIQETAKRIKRLGESSQEIGDIVSLINDIADQTNILSLNAAIQASMAGDAGKGFAVVADEVQRLAERSGAAAKQISALVKTIQSDTHEAVTSMEQTTSEVVQGTKLAQDAGVALGEIDSVSKSLAEIIENISDAARQQAASAGKISNTMKSIEDITAQTNEGTRSTVVAVGNLADITNELRSSVTGFKLPE